MNGLRINLAENAKKRSNQNDYTLFFFMIDSDSKLDGLLDANRILIDVRV